MKKVTKMAVLQDPKAAVVVVKLSRAKRAVKLSKAKRAVLKESQSLHLYNAVAKRKTSVGTF